MNTSFLRYFYALFLLCLVSTTHAAPASAELSTMLNAVKTMRATFTQIIYDNKGKAIQQAYGKMAMERPGKFRWEVTKPIPQLIIANQSRLWIYDPDLEQVTIRALAREAGETPALLLSRVDTVLDKDFAVKELQKNTPGWRWFELDPKKADNMFAAIQFGFLNGKINQMRLNDHLGHTTQVKFANIQTNMTLSPSLFTFKPSAKVDVIDETRKKH